MNTYADGYVRATLDEVLSVRFAHLISGLDESREGVARCGARTTISGYTEWVGEADPKVTVGWDWIVDFGSGQPHWRRVGPPRTNVLLVDGSAQDYDWNRSLKVLGTVVDALPWQQQASTAIAARYAH